MKFGTLFTQQQTPDADYSHAPFRCAVSTSKLVDTPEQAANTLISLKRNTKTTGAFIYFALGSPAGLETFGPVLPYPRESGCLEPAGDPRLLLVRVEAGS